MARRVLLCGATSGIAQELAKRLARDGDRLALVARNAERLDIVVDDLRVRGAERVVPIVADLDEMERHEPLIEEATAALDGLDTVIVAHGVLGDPDTYAADYAEAERVLRTNVLGVVSLLTPIARRFAEQGSGTIVGISSVAGDRGRGSNFVYGASKGAMSLYLQGLRNRLHPRGVRVLTVKPGMVDTPMTAHMEKGLLFASAAAVGRGIHRAMRGRGDVVYVPWWWRPIMAVIRAIPEPLFKRLKL